MFQEDIVSSYDLSLSTDASNIGMGGVFRDEWFSIEWPTAFSSDLCSTNYQEIFAIFTAVTLWAGRLSNKQILVLCDNETIVTVLTSGTCTSEKIMKVVWKMFYICAENNLSLTFEHVPGFANAMADVLSRLQVERFKTLHPTANKYPSRIPASIWNI